MKRILLTTCVALSMLAAPAMAETPGAHHRQHERHKEHRKHERHQEHRKHERRHDRREDHHEHTM